MEEYLKQLQADANAFCDVVISLESVEQVASVKRRLQDLRIAAQDIKEAVYCSQHELVRYRKESLKNR